MGVASRIGSQLYKALPGSWRQSWMYRSFTGEAMQLLKAGKTKEEATHLLWQLYVEPIQVAVERCSHKIDNASPAPQKRVYTKKDTTYWIRKSGKADKRKARQEKLSYYAGLMARAAAIGSQVYQSLPDKQKQYYFYKKLTGWAFQLLKEKMTDAAATEFLMNAVNNLLKLKEKKVKKRTYQTERKRSLFYIPNPHLSHLHTSRKIKYSSLV